MAKINLTKDPLHQQLVKYAEDVSRLYRKLKKENTSLAKANKELEGNYFETVSMGFDLINLHDDYLGSHSRRVSHYSYSLAILLGRNEKTISNVRLAALLHDIGLIGIPKNDLMAMFSSKTKAMNDIYINHPLVKIRPITSTRRYKDIANIISAHHESMDGSGFPKGLKGNKIPFESRIIAVVNDYDVIQTSREKVQRPEIVISKMKKDVGSKYDATIFEGFRNMIFKNNPFSDIINISVDELVPGMILAKTIVASGKIQLLSADTEIREDHITHIKKFYEYGRIKFPVKIYEPK